MENSAALPRTASTVTYLPIRIRSAANQPEQTHIRYTWTEELERRRRAVARWRGNDTGLKESMMRGPTF
jgi:hypothetical protein